MSALSTLTVLTSFSTDPCFHFQALGAVISNEAASFPARPCWTAAISSYKRVVFLGANAISLRFLGRQLQLHACLTPPAGTSHTTNMHAKM